MLAALLLCCYVDKAFILPRACMCMYVFVDLRRDAAAAAVDEEDLRRDAAAAAVGEEPRARS